MPRLEAVCALCAANYTRQGGACTYCPDFDAQNVAGVVARELAELKSKLQRLEQGSAKSID